MAKVQKKQAHEEEEREGEVISNSKKGKRFCKKVNALLVLRIVVWNEFQKVIYDMIQNWFIELNGFL